MRLKAPARRKGCGDARGVDNPSEATNGFKKLWSDLRWPARCTNRDAPRRPRPAVPGFLLQKTVPDTLSVTRKPEIFYLQPRNHYFSEQARAWTNTMCMLIGTAAPKGMLRKRI